MMDWQTAVLNAIRRLCERTGNTVFYRAALKDEELDRIISDTNSKGITPSQTMSRVLQELRDQGIIEFLDDHGTYRLLR